MNGKIVAIAIILIAAIAGAGLYYLQVYHYYFDLPEATSVELIAEDGTVVALPVSGFDGIDATSSPIRYRACFRLEGDPASLPGRYTAYEVTEPRVPPFWFDCFDTPAISEGIADGSIKTYLGGKNVAYGVDRIVAIADDGRGFAWNDLNNCGEKAFDGTVVGEECPERP